MIIVTKIVNEIWLRHKEWQGNKGEGSRGIVKSKAVDGGWWIEWKEWRAKDGVLICCNTVSPLTQAGLKRTVITLSNSLTHTHTHIHAHTPTHTYTHIHTHIHIDIHTHLHANSHTERVVVRGEEERIKEWERGRETLLVPSVLMGSLHVCDASAAGDGACSLEP